MPRHVPVPLKSPTPTISTQGPQTRPVRTNSGKRWKLFGGKAKTEDNGQRMEVSTLPLLSSWLTFSVRLRCWTLKIVHGSYSSVLWCSLGNFRRRTDNVAEFIFSSKLSIIYGVQRVQVTLTANCRMSVGARVLHAYPTSLTAL
jgi:hypothetical protein